MKQQTFMYHAHERVLSDSIKGAELCRNIPVLEMLIHEEGL